MADEYKMTMLTTSECPACKVAKEKLKDRISNGQIEVLEIDKNEDAAKMAFNYKIKGVPSIILKNKITNTTEICQLKADLSGVICKNKEVDF